MQMQTQNKISSEQIKLAKPTPDRISVAIGRDSTQSYDKPKWGVYNTDTKEFLPQVGEFTLLDARTANTPYEAQRKWVQCSWSAFGELTENPTSLEGFERLTIGQGVFCRGSKPIKQIRVLHVNKAGEVWAIV